jgi:glycosyltransferase involved in cell wall biosynthesis
MQRMNVLFITNIPSPYRTEFFNELGKYCSLTVLFEKRASNERDASWNDYTFWNFKGVFLKGCAVGADTAVCPQVIKYVKDRCYDKIVCTNVDSPTVIIAIEAMKWQHIPYWIEIDGGFAKIGNGPKEWIKRHLISDAVGYLSTGAAADGYLLCYGAAKEKIHHYPLSSTHSADIMIEAVSAQRKQALRDKLNMREMYIVISVGQFVARKGFDILLKVAAELDQGIGFYLIGGTPTEEYLRMKAEFRLKHVHFVAFQRKKDLQEYYRAADLFVLPTREDIWGLVINEAMENGLPVVTTKRCIAGLELVRNGKNGYLTDVDDIVGLAQAIRSVREQNTDGSFGECSIDIIRDYSIETMAKRHWEILGE